MVNWPTPNLQPRSVRAHPNRPRVIDVHWDFPSISFSTSAWIRSASSGEEFWLPLWTTGSSRNPLPRTAAAELANENCDRAMALAHKLAMQLRAAEDRIIQLEAEVSLFRDRVTRRRRVASNDPQRNRAKAHHPKISLWYRTNVGLIEFKYGTKSVSLWLSSSSASPCS